MDIIKPLIFAAIVCVLEQTPGFLIVKDTH